MAVMANNVDLVSQCLQWLLELRIVEPGVVCVFIVELALIACGGCGKQCRIGIAVFAMVV